MDLNWALARNRSQKPLKRTALITQNESCFPRFRKSRMCFPPSSFILVDRASRQGVPRLHESKRCNRAEFQNLSQTERRSEISIRLGSRDPERIKTETRFTVTDHSQIEREEREGRSPHCDHRSDQASPESRSRKPRTRA